MSNISINNLFQLSILRYENPADHPIRILARRAVVEGEVDGQIEASIGLMRLEVLVALRESGKRYATDIGGALYSSQVYKTVLNEDMRRFMDIFDVTAEAERERAKMRATPPPADRTKPLPARRDLPEWTEEV